MPDLCNQCGQVHPGCVAHRKRDHMPCERPLERGGVICFTHGGEAKQVRAKAAERRAEMDAQAAVAKFGWEPIPNPYGVLADMLGEMVAWKDFARSRVDELEQLTTRDGAGVEQEKALVKLYVQSLALASKTALDMGKLDLSARALAFQQAVDGAQAAWLGGVLEAVLVEAGLTDAVVGVVLAGLGRRLAQGEIAP